MSKTCPKSASKTQAAQHFRVSLTCVDGWTRRGCPVTIAGDGKKGFDLDAVELWRWFQDKKNNDAYFRDLCAQPIAEVIEAVHKGQGRLSFWTRANLDWNAPEAAAIHKALVKICDGCDDMSELAERHFPHLGRE